MPCFVAKQKHLRNLLTKDVQTTLNRLFVPRRPYQVSLANASETVAVCGNYSFILP